MKTQGLELLVYLSEDRAETTMDELRTQFSVTQVASRQIAVIRVEPEQKEAVEAVEGVQAVFEQQIPQHLFTQLDIGESLFVKAWSIRMADEPKPRPGEGLDWDAEGFEAPGISDEDWT